MVNEINDIDSTEKLHQTLDLGKYYHYFRNLFCVGGSGVVSSTYISDTTL